MDLIKEFTRDDFHKVIENSKVPVLVDFWASWCGPCRMLAPVIDDLALKYKDKVLVGKVNVDDEEEISEEFRIMTIPTIIIYSNGSPVERIVGVRRVEDYINAIEKHL